MDSQDHLGQPQHQRHQDVSQGQGLSHESIFGQVVLIRDVQSDKFINLKLFPDSQDHLGQAKYQRHQGIGQGQALPQGLIFRKSCINESCLG